MPRYPQGADVRISATITDATGALANASATLITMHNPAGTVTTYTTPTNDGVGLYHLDAPHADITTIGHYPWVWDATVSGSHAITLGAFDVYDPFEVAVLSLADAKDAVNIPQATTTSDDELRRMVASVEAVLERLTGGPILTTQVSERVDLDSSPWEIKLTKRPLVAVTSITDVSNGAAVDVSALDLDPQASMVRRKDGQQFITNNQVVTVVYTAGWGLAVPPAVNQAAAIILQSWWASQQAPGTLAFGQGGLQGGPGFATLPGALPDEALVRLAPFLKVGAVA